MIIEFLALINRMWFIKIEKAGFNIKKADLFLLISYCPIAT